MNSIIQEYYPLFEMYQALRNQLMDSLREGDLMSSPGGANPTLGVLCREIGEVQVNYIQSFQTFTQDFSYHSTDEDLETSVSRLKTWFETLDAELRTTLEGLSEEAIQQRVIDRGGGFEVSPRVQLEIYKEALLIFYGKVSVYLKDIGKIPPKQWQDWIA